MSLSQAPSWVEDTPLCGLSRGHMRHRKNEALRAWGLVLRDLTVDSVPETLAEGVRKGAEVLLIRQSLA